MDWQTIAPALLGGALIGVAGAALLALTGKVAGVSGIVDGLVRWERPELPWKAAFVAGLFLGGVLLARFRPEALPSAMARPPGWLLAGGFLVGFGARMGQGCTSGHGVCGIGRLSLRGLAATCVFIAVGAATVLAWRHWMEPA